MVGEHNALALRKAEDDRTVRIVVEMEHAKKPPHQVVSFKAYEELTPLPVVNKEALAELFEEVDKYELPRHGNLTARLVDEEDGNGLVELVNERGSPIYTMSREDYEAMKEWKPDEE